VPVGEDQIFHVELMREVARRFNHMYGREKIILPEPQHLLTDVPKLPGIDGQKMSKSYNNVIEIGEDKLSIEKKIKIMVTDPARIKRTDCGDPDKCPVWQLHKVYSNQEVTSWVDSGCRSAQIGCIDCKFKLIDAIEKEQQPIREKYNMYKKNNHIVDMVIEQGIEEASCIAKKTLLEVKDAMGINFG
jgi:tryptophanyl-tRNA synthetase